MDPSHQPEPVTVKRLARPEQLLLRDVQDDYRESVGPIVVPAGGATPGTIGGVGRLNVARRYVPRSDPRAATRLRTT